MLLGSTWANKQEKAGFLVTIVKLLGNHPDKNRKDEIIVLVLDLISGEPKELVFDAKKGEFPFTKLRRM